MASTNKTPQLGLNQWAAGDEVLRADFNADNAKIEAMLASAAGMPKIGTYKGDGLPDRIVDLGFHTRLVILFSFEGYRMRTTFIMEKAVPSTEGTSAGNLSGYFRLTPTGFQLIGNSHGNNLDGYYHYVAFG